MEALGGLAVAERDIRALGTTRADSCPLRRLRVRREPTSPFQSARWFSASTATEHTTSRRPVRPTLSLADW